MEDIILNEGQENAVDAIFGFLLSEEKEFNLKGPGGVGKTWLMKYIKDNLMKQYKNSCKLLGIPAVLNAVHFTATTNKAAEVLSEATGETATTVHSFFGLKVIDDYKTGKQKITKTTASKVFYGTVLFVDECSMIDSVLHKYILELTDKSCKIIYVGDHCQMAPVGEKISPIYGSTQESAELTQPVRNAGQPALMALCDQLRDTVKTGKFKPIQEVPGVIDYIDDDGLKLLLDQDFVDEEIDARCLCFTNARVKDYNDYIREIRGYPELYQPGEIVLNNSGIEIGDIMLRVEQPVRVMEILQQPYLLNIDPRGENTMMEVYEIRIKPMTRNDSIELTVNIPTDHEHYTKLCNYYASKRLWDVYWYLKKQFPDLRQKDAATVYKAQGSTYEYVVIDLSNIGKCQDADQVARMLYVAASRPRSRLYLYGRLPSKYQGV